MEEDPTNTEEGEVEAIQGKDTEADTDHLTSDMVEEVTSTEEEVILGSDMVDADMDALEDTEVSDMEGSDTEVLEDTEGLDTEVMEVLGMEVLAMEVLAMGDLDLEDLVIIQVC